MHKKRQKKQVKNTPKIAGRLFRERARSIRHSFGHCDDIKANIK